MDLPCALRPVSETSEHLALAERLGYRRAWVFDTAALPLNVWMTRPAERATIARELQVFATGAGRMRQAEG